MSSMVPEVFNDHDVKCAFDTVVSSLGFKLVPKDATPDERIDHLVTLMVSGTKVPGCILYDVVRNTLPPLATGPVVPGQVIQKEYSVDDTHVAVVLTTYVKSKHIRDLTVDESGHFVNKHHLLTSDALKDALKAFFDDLSTRHSSDYSSVVFRVDHPKLTNVPRFVDKEHVLFKIMLKLKKPVVVMP